MIERDRLRKAAFDAKRPSASSRGYNRNWQRDSKVYLKANPLCSHPGCTAPATVVDHITAHKGNVKLFWNRANWQSLCSHHHNSAKQAQERRNPRP